jgi:hypothetical protein
MNNRQCEQFLTDLTPAQAETTAGGSPFDDIPGPSGPTRFASAAAFYGNANSRFRRRGPSAFSTQNFFVKDSWKDGHPVYAQFQGMTANGSILNAIGTRRFDFKTARGPGTFHPSLVGTFTRSVKKLRLVIMRQNPGRDLFVAGHWVDF